MKNDVLSVFIQIFLRASPPSPDMGLAQQTLALCKPSVQKRVCTQTQACDTPTERSEDDGGVTGPHAKQVLPRPSVRCPVETSAGSLGPGVLAPLHDCSRGLGSCNQLI